MGIKIELVAHAPSKTYLNFTALELCGVDMVKNAGSQVLLGSQKDITKTGCIAVHPFFTTAACALLTTFILLLLSAGAASATCVAPYDDMLINSNTLLCGGDYFINDAGANGVIIIDGNGFTLDGNGSVIHGTGNAGIVNTAGNGNNVILKNMTFSGYATGASITVVDNIKIQDANFTGNGNNIYFLNTNNSEILNTLISGASVEGIYVSNSKNITIYNSTITQNAASGIYLSGTTDSLIDDNTIVDNGDGIYLTGSSENNISDNIIDYGLESNDYGIRIFFFK